MVVEVLDPSEYAPSPNDVQKAFSQAEYIGFSRGKQRIFLDHTKHQKDF